KEKEEKAFVCWCQRIYIYLDKYNPYIVENVTFKIATFVSKMAPHLTVLLFATVLLFSVTNTAFGVKCTKKNLHVCLGGNGKRSAVGIPGREHELMNIIARGLPDQRAERRDDTFLPDKIYNEREVQQKFLSPLYKRLARETLNEDLQYY
ncbi:hypothetical protein Ahia01_000654300, partial [Argonauta hians]